MHLSESENFVHGREVISVSELTQVVKGLIESELDSIWLTGEISNFKRHSSGHFYFSLKDERSQIPCVMWANRNRSLYFAPDDGMQVVVHGRVTVYERRGYYQFDVWQMQPAGVGALQLAFEQLKQRLQKEGLFDPEQKVDLPEYPECIGIVTSPTGAAIRDFVSVLRRRWPPIRIILRPVRVQGEGAAEEIAAAIAEFNDHGKADVLLIGRGGGSLEDLWPFNEEIVARAIYDSNIPVVSAVGHEVDYTISDFVADFRAATPSVAAEIIVPLASEVRRELFAQLKRAYLSWRTLRRSNRQRLDGISRSYGLRRPQDILKQRRQELDDLYHRFSLSIRQRLQRMNQDLEARKERLNALSHENILKRGFALVFKDANSSEIASRAKELETDDRVRIQFSDGSVKAVVE